MKTNLIATFISLALAPLAAAAPNFGVSAGYLVDSQEEFIAARLGFEVAKGQTLSHQLEFEAGYTADKELGIEARIVPLLINYRATTQLTAATDLSFGVGAGISNIKVSGFGLRSSDNPFTGQAFVGAGYALSPAVALTGSVRYIKIANASFFNTQVDVGDDVALELGLRFRF